MGGPRSRLRRWATVLLIAASTAADVPPAPQPTALDVRYTVRQANGQRFPPRLSTAYERQRLDGVRTLLDRRAAAVQGRDKAAFLDGVDPAAAAFRAEQETLFDGLMQLPLSTWEYDVLTEPAGDVRTIDPGRYDGDVWLPYVRLRYSLGGFDQGQVARQLDYTFVRRGSRWLLAADRDLDLPGLVRRRRDPWDFGPIAVRRTANALVITHRDDTTAAALVAVADKAVADVSTVWGTDWSRQVVVVVAAAEEERRSLSGDRDGEQTDHVVATAMPQYNHVPEMEEEPTGPILVGHRVVVGPRAVREGLLTRRLLAHEFAHVATGHHSTAGLPDWLLEGLAEYVERLGWPPFPQAARLADRVARHSPPATLPAQFSEVPIDRQDDYVASGLLCRLIAMRHGRDRLVRLYRTIGADLQAVGSPSRAEAAKVVEAAIRKVLGTTQAALTAAWQRYLRHQLRRFDGVFATFPDFRLAPGDDGSERAGGGDKDDFVPIESHQWFRGPAGRPTTRIVVTIWDYGDDTNTARMLSRKRGRPEVPGIPGTTIHSGELQTFFGTFSGWTTLVMRGRFLAQVSLFGDGSRSEFHRIARRQYRQFGLALAAPQP